MTRRLSMQLAAAMLLTLVAILTALSGKVRAGDQEPVKVGDIEISRGWVRAMLPAQKVGGGYLAIVNNGAAGDRLVSAASPAAKKVEIHSMEVVNDVMTMRPVEGGLEIAPGATVELKPGGLHLMFMAVAEPFADGASVPVTLEFEKAGKVEIDLPVHTASASSAHATH